MHLVAQAKKKLEQERKKAAEKKDVASKQPQEKRCLPSEGLRGLILFELPYWPGSFRSYCTCFLWPTAGLNNPTYINGTWRIELAHCQTPRVRYQTLSWPNGCIHFFWTQAQNPLNPLVKQGYTYLAGQHGKTTYHTVG